MSEESQQEVERPLPERKVIYRLTNEEYDTMSRIADMLYKRGTLKVNSVNALAKAAAFTQINIYLGYEAKEKAFQKWQDEERVKSEKLRQNMAHYNLGGF